MADGAVRGTVLLGLLLVGGAFLGRTPAPVDSRIIRIEGEVSRPGWYEADDLAAAVRDAGGRPVLLTSAPIRDGDVVRLSGGWAIPDREHVPVEAVALGRKLRLNRASAAEIETLPGIGPTLARRIVEGRPYRTLADVDRVKGIGPAKLRALERWAEP